MGYYIQVPQNKGKAKQICDLYEGEIIPQPKSYSDIPADKALICIVDNGAFEAAGFCCDGGEFRAFVEPDSRPRTWVLMSRKKAEELTKFRG